MQRISFFVLILTMSFITLSCSNSSSEKAVEQVDLPNTGVVYSCPMHPEVRADKPGQCPKCGMDLVEEKSSGVYDSTQK